MINFKKYGVSVKVVTKIWLNNLNFTNTLYYTIFFFLANVPFAFANCKIQFQFILRIICYLHTEIYFTTNILWLAHLYFITLLLQQQTFLITLYILKIILDIIRHRGLFISYVIGTWMRYLKCRKHNIHILCNSRCVAT